jgi:2-methylcitrate dehydratase PrpD
MPKFVMVGQEDPMSTLCRMVVDTKYEDLPTDVVDYAKRSILDTMAVTIGGSAMEGIPAVVDLVKEKGGKPESIIPFYGGKVPASEAGLAIGPMSRALDLGDYHAEAGHSSEYTFPTLLAATGLKDKVSGREFITAYVVGQEVLLRIGKAYKGLSKARPLGRGSGCYIFGAVAAAGKLLGLSLNELQNAEGIARNMTQPHDMHEISTLIVRVHHGFICQDAINACLLAKRGITGPRQDVLVGPRGYLGFAKWETDPDALTKGLGEEWEMLEVIMKPYPCCGGTHTAIGGILDQMREYNFTAEDIANIDIEVSQTGYLVTCTPKEAKWNPQTVQDCQFSMPYVVATAAYDKDFFISSYTPQAMARKEVRDLMNKISAKVDASLPVQSARVHTTLKDGTKVSKEYIYAKGDPKDPFTEQEVIDKLKKCVPYSAYKLSDGMVDSLVKVLLSLEEVDDVVSVLLLPLTGQATPAC